MPTGSCLTCLTCPNFWRPAGAHRSHRPFTVSMARQGTAAKLYRSLSVSASRLRRDLSWLVTYAVDIWFCLALFELPFALPCLAWLVRFIAAAQLEGVKSVTVIPWRHTAFSFQSASCMCSAMFSDSLRLTASDRTTSYHLRNSRVKEAGIRAGISHHPRSMH